MTTLDPLAPIDYAARWRALVAGRDEQRGAGYRDGDAERDPWRSRADRFATYSERLPDDDQLFARLRAEVRPEDTILDVGAGAGRYTVPLARLARRVVAVEPSPAMLGHLGARIAAAGADNVAVVGAAWPDAEVEPADVVLCSHVVYGVREIVMFDETFTIGKKRMRKFSEEVTRRNLKVKFNIRARVDTVDREVVRKALHHTPLA